MENQQVFTSMPSPSALPWSFGFPDVGATVDWEFPTVSPAMCSPEAISTPNVYGAEILSQTVSLVQNFTQDVPEYLNFNHPTIHVQNAAFCNITVSYTHPGQNDTINVEAWLPLNWNGRMKALGGGGFSAGRFIVSYAGMAGAMGEGYAAITTDAGLSTGTVDSTPWALLSPGNVNWYAIQNLASVSLNDQAIIGKSLIQNFYGQPPKYSYWSGCSQGGRQGLMLAQRYPGAYDGIVASAPAIYFNKLLLSMFWPQLVMNLMGEYPHTCELKELSAAAIKACDGNDGIIDGLISDIDSCHFDPFSAVGTDFHCTENGSQMQISKAAATVANATWNGATSLDGKFLWYGLSHGSDLVGTEAMSSIATTKCSSNGTCAGVPNHLATVWLKHFAHKDASYDYTSMTRQDFDRLFRTSVQQFTSFLGTDDPDLSEFRDSGGKMITFHGLDDFLIPAKGTEHYYKAVSDLIPDVHDFYRYFEVPGLGHCYGGNGGQPTAVFELLRAWVENGTAPDSIPISVPRANGTDQKRILCPYPKKFRFNNSNCNGDSSDISCCSI